MKQLKLIAISLFLTLEVVTAQGATPEKTQSYQIAPNYSIELTSAQYNAFQRHFTLKRRDDDWANYKYYAQSNDTLTIKVKGVFMGDSITQGWWETSPEFFTENSFIGRGINGQTTQQMLSRFQSDVVNHKPKFVVILAGTNDLARNNGVISKEHIVENIKSMCQIATANGIKPVVCSILPAYSYYWYKELGVVAEDIVEINAMIKECAKEQKVLYVDLHSKLKDERNGLPANITKDGVHLNKDGYDIIEGMLLPKLKKLMR